MSENPSYDPFGRGPHPVGVRSLECKDEARERTLPLEVWYPATSAHRGQDLDPEHQDSFQTLPMAPPSRQAAVRDAESLDGEWPMVVFSHGFGGERRQTTHLCTHLASHGYVVASMDHVGNTSSDMMTQMMAAQAGGEMPNPLETVRDFAHDRPLDASFVIDRMLAGDAGVRIDPERIGMTGHSFGGWTTLQTSGRDPRIRAALPLAPAGGRAAVATSEDGSDFFERELDLGWEREVPTLFLVADNDSILPLAGMRELIERTPEPKRALVLRNSDHFHFCDGVEQVHDLFKQMGALVLGAGERADDPQTQALYANMKPSAELCPGEHAVAWIQGLGLAHMDAHIRGDAVAAAFLDRDLIALMREHGIEVDLIG